MKSILVVDDDKTNLALARSVLSGTYKIFAVTSGRQALKFLENGNCDLILLDINMPEMDGFEVMTQIQEDSRWVNIPVIFLTAESDAQTENKCFAAGARDYIAKPFVAAVMLSRIGRILELEDARRQLADKLEQKIREVSDIKNRIQQDALTGLWNRNYTENAVNELVKNGTAGTFFMIDMDNFKLINDRYGHIEGDNTLKMFADTMRTYAGKEDILCRIGGDEFVMFIPENTDKREISALAGNIISDLCSKLKDKKLDTNSSVSIGISQAPEDGTDFNKIYNAADKALYYVKQNGKNSFHYFSQQKSDERIRGNTLVDLQNLRDILVRADSGNGAYQLELESFHHVYNFIRRFVERNGRNVQTVLFTAYTENGVSAEQDEIDAVLGILEQSIYHSLRRVDVSTRYSNKQIIVILMDADSENGEMVAKRIYHNFEKSCDSGHIKIRYDIAKMETEGQYT